MLKYDLKQGGIYTRLQNSPSCRDVVRLAVKLKLLSQDQIAANELTQVRRDKERAQARAAKCDVARAEKAPSRNDLVQAINGFLLANCNNLAAMMRMFSRGQTQNPLSLALAKLQREGSWCVMKALTVKLSLKWNNVTQHRCARLGSGGYACHITGFLDCRSNARDRLRRQLECALYTLPQRGVVLATYDAPACAWRAIPVEK